MARPGRLFKCTSCGHEVRLQAWKAVCPSCERGFTLVPITTEERRPRHRFIGYVAPLLITSYLILTFVAPALTASRLLPWPAAQLLLAIAAILSLTSSLVGNLAASASGAAILAAHLYTMTGPTTADLAMLMIGAALITTGILNEFIIRRDKNRE